MEVILIISQSLLPLLINASDVSSYSPVSCIRCIITLENVLTGWCSAMPLGKGTFYVLRAFRLQLPQFTTNYRKSLLKCNGDGPEEPEPFCPFCPVGDGGLFAQSNAAEGIVENRGGPAATDRKETSHLCGIWRT